MYSKMTFLYSAMRDLWDQTRPEKLFYKTFNYVEPTEIYLGFDTADTEGYFYYVPTKETLKALLTQETVKEQYRQTKINVGVMSDSESDVLADVNGLLKEDPSSFSIELH